MSEQKDTFDSTLTVDHHQQLESLIQQTENHMTSQLHVSVRRGKPIQTETGDHPTFETILEYDPSKPAYAASRRFEAYRNLFKELYAGSDMCTECISI